MSTRVAAMSCLTSLAFLRCPKLVSVRGVVTVFWNHLLHFPLALLPLPPHVPTGILGRFLRLRFDVTDWCVEQTAILHEEPDLGWVWVVLTGWGEGSGLGR